MNEMKQLAQMMLYAEVKWLLLDTTYTLIHILKLGTPH